jgi:uncharacterized protein YyaL (SSP411 family)
LLRYLAQAWAEQRPAIEQQAAQLVESVQTMLHLEPGMGDLEPRLLRSAGTVLARSFDASYGGFGSAPKFPHALELRLLLRSARRFDDTDALNMVRYTLDHMARGGMYDQLGGGFHRYSTDARWLVPHFEKMLYDNALLVPAYLEAFQVTGDAFYRRIVDETLGYVLREMTAPEGAFYSTQDADSEGVEGKFFVWSVAEIEQVLGKEEAQLFCSVYGVSAEGNWEGHNILNLSRPLAQEARLLQVTEDELRQRLDRSRKKLLEVRNRRVWPGRDDKILTSWNGLMIAAFAQSCQVLETPAYLDAARRAADFVLSRMRGKDGRLLRTCGAGAPAKLNAYLEDYAFLADALVTLYEASFEPRWLETALALAGIMIDRFWDDAEGGFFYTGNDHEQLIARTKDPHDSSIPSGNSMAVTALLRLAKLTGRRDLFDKAERTLHLFKPLLSTAPQAAAQMLNALDFYLGPVDEVVVAGATDAADTRQALRLIRQRYCPNRVLAFKPQTGLPKDVEKMIPLLADKTSAGPVTTYLCQDFACQTPLVGLEALQARWPV